MKHRLVGIIAAVAACVPVIAQQEGPIRLPLPQLTRYLELTAEQRNGLLRLQAEWTRFLAEKQQRVVQVERELRLETNARVPDPVSLGVRYAELEAICREARDKDNEIMRTARRLLTPAQTTKLQTLEAAYSLLPVIAEADLAGLIRAPLPSGAVGGLLIAEWPASQQYPGCRYPAAGAN